MVPVPSAMSSTVGFYNICIADLGYQTWRALKLDKT